MSNSSGLKALRCGKGPTIPNKFWLRKARPKCTKCRRRIRGPNHLEGAHCKFRNSLGTRFKWTGKDNQSCRGKDVMSGRKRRKKGLS